MYSTTTVKIVPKGSKFESISTKKWMPPLDTAAFEPNYQVTCLISNNSLSRRISSSNLVYGVDRSLLDVSGKDAMTLGFCDQYSIIQVLYCQILGNIIIWRSFVSSLGVIKSMAIYQKNGAFDCFRPLYCHHWHSGEVISGVINVRCLTWKFHTEGNPSREWHSIQQNGKFSGPPVLCISPSPRFRRWLTLTYQIRSVLLHDS